MSEKHSHYKKDVRHLDSIDVYRVIDLFDVKHPALQHALKKIMCLGQRGAKDARQDAQEAIDSLERYMAMQDEDGRIKPLDLTVIDERIKADKAEDPHAELRKIYKPGMRWRVRGGGVGERFSPWIRPGENENPMWVDSCIYEIHPDDLPKQDEDGYTIWHGGEQPEETKGKMVNIKFRLTGDPDRRKRKADEYFWRHETSYECHSDIIAYKVIE